MTRIDPVESYLRNVAREVADPRSNPIHRVRSKNLFHAVYSALPYDKKIELTRKYKRATDERNLSGR